MSRMVKEPLVIVLAGMPACGKGSFVSILMGFLQAWTVKKLAFGDPLRNWLKHMRVKKIGREALSKLSNCLDEIQSGALADFIKHEIEHSDADIIILDGARWEYDIDMLLGMPNVIIVFIDTNAKERFKRAQQRALYDKENGKPDEAEITEEEFLAIDMSRTEAYISQIARRAHFYMTNHDGGKEGEKILAVKVEDFFKSWVLDRLPKETPQQSANVPAATAPAH